MEIIDISDRYVQNLYNAASLWVTENEPQLMLELIHQIQHESIKEGYESAIEVLQNNFKEIIGG